MISHHLVLRTAYCSLRNAADRKYRVVSDALQIARWLAPNLAASSREPVVSAIVAEFGGTARWSIIAWNPHRGAQLSPMTPVCSWRRTDRHGASWRC
jgi:hypothetical protein